jgi:hypothetical protein
LRLQPELAAQGFDTGRDRIVRLRKELGLRCNGNSTLSPMALPNLQPHWDLTVYDPLVKRNSPDTSTAARAVAVALENSIRFNGAETGAFFNTNGQLITKKAGAPDHVHFDEHELVGTTGSLFTHNHPDGLSFSGLDVESAVSLELVELRAVTSYCRYILQPSTLWPSWQAIKDALHRHTPAARQEVCAMLHACQLANGHVDKEFLHRLWVLVSNELQLKYTREVS